MAAVKHAGARLARDVEGVHAEVVRGEISQRRSVVEDAADRERLIDPVVTEQGTASGFDLLDAAAQGRHEEMPAGAEGRRHARPMQFMTPYRRAGEHIVRGDHLVIARYEHHNL